MTPTNGIPCAGLGRDDEDVEVLTEADLIEEGNTQDAFPPDSLEGEGCSALFRTNWIRPAN